VADLADLFLSPAFRAALVRAMVVRARTGAALPAQDTPARQRLNRRILGQPDRLSEWAGKLALPVAANATIRTAWLAAGTLADADVEYEVEQQLVAWAARVAPDAESIAHAMTHEPTLRVLAAALARAATQLLTSAEVTDAQRRWIRQHLASPELARATAQKLAHFLVTLTALLPYSGDLSDAPDAAVASAVAGFLPTWIATELA